MPNFLFSNYTQIEKYMEKLIKETLDEISDIVKQKLYDLVEDRLYDAYSPSNYERTKELINAISKTQVAKTYGSHVVEIFYDTKKIFPYITGEGNWNKHADWYGNDVSDLIPLFVEYGTVGSLWDRDGIFAIRDTQAWISKEYNRLFRETLKYKGIPIQ